jgi:hypothetical protein
VKVPCVKRKPYYVAGWRISQPSACISLFLLITNECLKDSTNGEKANIETFEIIESYMARATL